MAQEARDILLGLAEIDVPVVAAINRPVHIHPEIPMLADIVIAADTATFLDSHIRTDIVPRDGRHIVWRRILGNSRASYFMLMEERMSAQDPSSYDAAYEICTADRVLARAWVIAERLARKPNPVLSHSRTLFAQPLREALAKEMPLGLALEELAIRS